MNYINATNTYVWARLYMSIDRSIWIACDIKTRTIYGRLNGEYFA